MIETLQMLDRGGITMYPLGLCSLVALTIIIERAFALRRAAVLEPRLLDLVEEYQGEENASIALAVCRRSRSVFARIIEQVVQTRHLDHAQAIEAISAVGRTQMAALERGLTLLEIVAGVSPLLGLLGTVLGLVAVFEAITAQGIGDPQVLSDGISKALVTTVAGLVVAIPALAFHSWFSRRVEILCTEMQHAATRFAFKVRPQRNGAGIEI